MSLYLHPTLLALTLAAGLPGLAQNPEQEDRRRPVRIPVPRVSQASQYSLKAVDQPDGSILVTFELKVRPELGVVERQGTLYSRFTNLTQFLDEGPEGFPETLSRQATLHVDPRQTYRVETVDSHSLAFPFEYPYLPARREILRSEDPARVPYRIAPASLKGGCFPAQPLQSAEPFAIRNVAGHTLRFAITQVDPSQQVARVYDRLVFRLVPTRSQNEMTRMAAPDRKLPSELHGPLQAMFLNAGTSTAEVSRTAWPYELADAGEILVLYTSRDKAAIQPYIDHKRSLGFVVNAQEVAKGTNVKTTVQQAYTANPRILYVQLVGDWADIQCDTITSDGETCAADNALGLVAGNDKFLDLIIGRFSAESADQVTTQVNKVIAYEKAGKQAWWTKALSIASAEGAGNGDDGEADYQHEDVIKTNKLLAKGYTTVATAYDNPTKASLSAATTPINAGLHLINYTGHGIHYGWGTTGMNITAVDNLTNGDKLPIIFSVACVVGQYNTQTCFAESWLRKQNGGAVGAVMSTIYQPWQPPMRGQDYMNDLLTGGYSYTAGPGNGTDTDHGKPTLGAIVMNALNLMLGESSTTSDIDTAKSWVVFGDAALKVTSDGVTPPTGPSISTQPANQAVNAGQTATFTVVASGTSLAYQWKKNGSDISGATSASYTTPATTVSDSGSSFTVTVSNAQGSVTSSAATLTVNPVPAEYKEAESNNTLATANAVPDAATSITGTIASSTDADYFRLTVGAGKTLKAVMTGPTGSTYDYDLYLLNTSGSTLTSSTGSTCSETVSWRNTGTTPVSVVLYVKRYKGQSTTLGYTIALTR